jgi:rsbT co-antagonist protein RsbR
MTELPADEALELHDASSAKEALDLRVEAMTRAFELLPDIVFIKDAELRYVMSNKAGADILGQTPESMVGKRMRDVFPEEAAATLDANDRQIFADGRPVSLEENIPVHGLGMRTFLATKTPFYKEDGSPHFLVGIAQDITERKRAEEALEKSREELRETRTNLLETIRELSTPVLPIHDGVLVVPLIGHLDTQRSAQFTDALLLGIQRHRADAVIIDVTGVDYIDNAVANHLLVTIRAAALLGTECVVVGISPKVSRTLTQIGFDFSSVVTRRDLQAGVAYAVERHAEEVDEEEDDDEQEPEGDLG